MVSALNSVDLPTLGRPTMPMVRATGRQSTARRGRPARRSPTVARRRCQTPRHRTSTDAWLVRRHCVAGAAIGLAGRRRQPRRRLGRRPKLAARRGLAARRPRRRERCAARDCAADDPAARGIRRAGGEALRRNNEAFVALAEAGSARRRRPPTATSPSASRPSRRGRPLRESLERVQQQLHGRARARRLVLGAARADRHDAPDLRAAAHRDVPAGHGAARAAGPRPVG